MPGRLPCTAEIRRVRSDSCQINPMQAFPVIAAVALTLVHSSQARA
jgi:succinate dehydrogenase/fumarate reductase-like Fe-S protein